MLQPIDSCVDSAMPTLHGWGPLGHAAFRAVIHQCAVALLAFGFVVPPSASADSPTVIRAPWGTIQLDPSTGWAELELDQPLASIEMPDSVPHVVRAVAGTPFWSGKALAQQISQDGSQRTISLSSLDSSGAADEPELPRRIALELAATSGVFPDGRIVLAASTAEVVGQRAKLESQPLNQRIGFWTDADERVRWTLSAKRPGRYRLLLTYSLQAPPATEDAGNPGSEIPGSEIEVRVNESALPVQLVPTNSWYRYESFHVGDVYLDRPGDHTVEIACVNKSGAAVMNLRALSWVPISEGEPPQQADDGSLLLHARDATVRGVQLQWEPKENKRTLGFWTQVEDSAYWDFSLQQAGTFDVEILQGCGPGHGGSRVEYRWYRYGEDRPHSVQPHTVVDTGHWQAFQPFSLGKVTLAAGSHRLHVRAIEKPGVAVMDLRQVRLPR